MPNYTSFIPGGTPVPEPPHLNRIGFLVSILFSLALLALIGFIFFEFSMDMLGRPLDFSKRIAEEFEEEDRPAIKRDKKTPKPHVNVDDTERCGDCHFMFSRSSPRGESGQTREEQTAGPWIGSTSCMVCHDEQRFQRTHLEDSLVLGHCQHCHDVHGKEGKEMENGARKTENLSDSAP